MNKKLLAVCLLSSISILPLSASLLVNEGFDYPNGNLAGNSGAEGLDRWGLFGTNGTGTITVNNNKAIISGTNSTWIRADFVEDTPGSVVYFSFDIAEISAPSLTSGSVTDTVRFKSGSNNILSVGMRYDSTGQWLSLGLSDAAPSSVGVALQPSTTHQIVGKLSFNGGTASELTLWLNPTAESTPSAYTTTWNSGQTTMNRVELLRFVYGAGDSAAATSSYDDLRVGTDWNSVAVPEPSTAALAGLFGGLLAFLYRR